MKTRVFAMLACVVLGSDAWAARSIALFPMRMDTVAGGAMGPTSPTGVPTYLSSAVSCVTADIINLPAGAIGGPIAAIHYYTLSLRNISDLPQTVGVTIEKGSSVTSRISNPGSVAPDGPTRSTALGADSTYTTTLAKSSAATGSSATISIFVGCSKGTCWIAHPGGTAAGAAEPLLGGTTCPVAAQATCMTATSDMHFRLSVAEDRGAVVGSISTSAHRACGYKDHFIEPPPFVQINGGRPF